MLCYLGTSCIPIKKIVYPIVYVCWHSLSLHNGHSIMELLFEQKVCHFICMSEINDAEIPLGNNI